MPTMTMNFTMIETRTFSPEYADGVLSVILPIQQDEFQVPITLEDQPDLLDIPGFYQRGAGNFWVALEQNRVVGTIALIDIGNGQGTLRKMFVQAEYRGKAHGVAQRLLGTLLDWCAQQGMHEVYLGTTAKYLAAHRFYEKNGFAEMAKEALPATFPLVAVDTKFYLWRSGTGRAVV
ncbi:MAG TPA: GNAT family N-acetyltransferase [Noviherbaspirillum sp.]|uniref:GNAT family N-acetyltransferase n=1 Tax=Noviherbaspirillum sp. TaxID=1926288 RepID=UPI002B48CD9D|nr:GNAT family N-acetyltransferase [Noviherbaspirillum sp.]HJV87471.1 GNAT family N-acetyltransferase [Noviherbaspirillum sp.]